MSETVRIATFNLENLDKVGRWFREQFKWKT